VFILRLSVKRVLPLVGHTAVLNGYGDLVTVG